MKKFDLRKMIAENKATFFSSLKEEETFALDTNQVMNVAQQVADKISTPETTYTVNHSSIEADPTGAGFDLDSPYGEYEGGSYVILQKDGKHHIYNAALGNKYIGYVTPEGKVEFEGLYETIVQEKNV